MMRKRISIRTKILLLVLLVVLTTTGISSGIAIQVMTNRMRWDSHNELIKDSLFIQQRLGLMYEKTLADVQSFTLSKDVVQAVTASDSPALTQLVSRLSQIHDLPYVTITDQQGIVLVRVPARDQSGDDIRSIEIIQKMMAGRTVQAILQDEATSTLVFIAGMPIYDLEPPYRLIGTIQVGFALDDIFLAGLKSISREDFSIIVGGERIITTLPIEQSSAASVTGTSLPSLSIQHIGEQSYAVISVPLAAEDNDNPVGSLEIAKSQANLNAAILQAIYFILLGGFVFLILGFVLTLILTNQITQPLARLTTAAEKIGKGNYQQKVDIRSGDELETLGHAFAQMAEAISEHQQALQESEEKYSRIFKNTSLGIFQSTPEGKAILVNPAFSHMFGYDSPTDALKSIQNVSTDLFADPKRRTEIIRLMEENPSLRTFENVYRRKDGSTFIGSLNSMPIRDEQGRLIRIEGLIEDITERKRAEEALRENEEKFRGFVKSSSEGFSLVDEQGAIIEWNPAHEKITGLPASQVIGQKLWDIQYQMVLPELQTPELYERFKQTLLKALQTGQSPIFDHVVEAEVMHPDRPSQFIQQTIFPIKTDKGYRIGSVTRDVSERKLAMQELVESEERYRKLIEISNDAIMVYQDSKCIFANPAAATLLGAEKSEELIGSEPYMQVHPDYLEAVKRRVIKMKEEMTPSPLIEEKYIRLDGSMVYVETAAIPFIYRGRFAFQVIKRDITLRKQTEELIMRQTAELHKRNEELAHLYRASGALISRTAVSLHEQAKTIVEVIQKEFGQSNCSLLFIRQESNELERLAASGPYVEQLKDNPLTLDGQGQVAKAIREDKLINVSDVRTTKNYVSNWETARSEMTIPLKIGKKVIGAIDIQSEEINAFDTDDEQMMDIFSERAALALESACLYESAQRRFLRLSAIQKLGTNIAAIHTERELLDAVINETRKFADTPVCTIILLDTKTSRVVNAYQSGLPEGTPLGLYIPAILATLQKSINSGDPILIRDIDQDYPEFRQYISHQDTCSFQIYPLIYENQILGCITISHTEPHLPSDEEITAIKLLAQQTAVALENTKLFEQTNRRMRRLVALRRIDTAIANSFDIDFILNTLLEQIETQLHVAAAAVLIHNPANHALKYSCGRGFRTNRYMKTTIKMGEGLAGQVAYERRMVVIPDLTDASQSVLKSWALSREGFVSYWGVPLISKGQVKGVLEVYHRERFSPPQEWLDFFEAMADQAAIAIDNSELFMNMHRSNTELALAYDNTIEGWANALEMRDKSTEGHTQRVTRIAIQLAEIFHIKGSEITFLRWGALMHDIGKMAIPDKILLKTGSLSEEEMKIMHQHPQYAYDMISPIAYLRQALDIPYCHHERWDGSGYPRGLKGEEIPLAARIFTVVDVWDALLSDRPYRKAWTKKKALQFLRQQAGKQFDPKIVEAFIKEIVDREST